MLKLKKKRKILSPAVDNPKLRGIWNGTFFAKKSLRLLALRNIIWDLLETNGESDILGGGTSLFNKQPASDLSFHHKGHQYKLVLTETGPIE